MVRIDSSYPIYFELGLATESWTICRDVNQYEWMVAEAIVLYGEIYADTRVELRRVNDM